MLENQRLSDDRANTTGAHKPGKCDDLNREEKQFAHGEGKLSGPRFIARLLTEGESR